MSNSEQRAPRLPTAAERRVVLGLLVCLTDDFDSSQRQKRSDTKEARTFAEKTTETAKEKSESERTAAG